jgi:hypothetical protein
MRGLEPFIKIRLGRTAWGIGRHCYVLGIRFYSWRHFSVVLPGLVVARGYLI